MATDDYSDLYEAAGHKHNVDPALLRAVVNQESRGNPNTPDSPKGAKGVAQITGPTAKGLGVDPYNPAQAIDGAAQLLSDSLDRNNGDVGQAIAEYHGGPNRKIWGPKTAQYQKDVLAAYQGGGKPDVSDDDVLSMAAGNASAKSVAPASGPSDDEILRVAGGGGGDAQFTADHPKMIHPTELSKPDLQIYQHLLQGGLMDTEAPAGSEKHPLFNTDVKQVPAGAYYVQGGKMLRAPGGAKESSATAGLGQGVGDIAASISHILPGSDNSDLKNSVLGAQDIYNAKYGGDPISGAGRFTGQLIGSAPLLAGGEAIAAPVLENAGAVGSFLAGNAGKAALNAAGKKVGGNILLRGASLAAQGAQTGAGAAALTSSANEGSLAHQMAEGAVGGGIVGPLAPAIEGAGGAVVRGVKSLVEPLTPRGPSQIANRIVGDLSSSPVRAADAREIIPGSVPTLGQASGDPGLATLERTIRLGEHGPAFVLRDEANKTARSEFLDNLRGDDEHIQSLRDAREAATGGAREAALGAQSAPADIKPVLDTIDGILAGPEGKRSEVVKALTAVRNNLFDAKGNPETNAAMLYGVRKDLGDLLSPKASADKSGAQLAASQLKQVQGSLDDAIQNVAPGFKEYLANYSALSKPIDEAQWLQQQKLTDKDGNPTLAKVQGALDRLQAQKAKPGAGAAKSVSDDTVAKLTALRDDLKRAGNLTLQKPGGSDTAQHLTTGGRLQQAGIPSAALLAMTHHPVGALAAGASKVLYGMKDKQIMAEVANRLLNPQGITAPVVAQAKRGLLQRLGSGVNTAIPAAAGITINNRLVGAQ